MSEIDIKTSLSKIEANYQSALFYYYFAYDCEEGCKICQEDMTGPIDCTPEEPCGQDGCEWCMEAGFAYVSDEIKEIERIFPTSEVSEVRFYFSHKFKIEEITPSLILQAKSVLVDTVKGAGISNHWWLGHLHIVQPQSHPPGQEIFEIFGLIYTWTLTEDEFDQLIDAADDASRKYCSDGRGALLTHLKMCEACDYKGYEHRGGWITLGIGSRKSSEKYDHLRAISRLRLSDSYIRIGLADRLK